MREFSRLNMLYVNSAIAWMLLSNEYDTFSRGESYRNGHHSLPPSAASSCCNSSILNYVGIILALGPGSCYDTYATLSLYPTATILESHGRADMSD
jgi:hypothetical protein